MRDQGPMPMNEGRPALPPGAGGGRPMNMPMPMPMSGASGHGDAGRPAGETPMAMPMPMGPRSPAATAEGEGTPALGVPGTPLSDLEAMAFNNNPTLVQAQAQVDASLSKSFQAGLLPNPIAGYVSEQMGAGGGPGETQGGSSSRRSRAAASCGSAAPSIARRPSRPRSRSRPSRLRVAQRRPGAVLRGPGRPEDARRSSGTC